ncbi:hypothetical protein [Hydrogenophaga sp. 2FB]|uniref:hypothetical protein n=1 Tax=Hydrogenophaga sp. 2FB TaxID=2502187 RepID=UPI0010F69141|nr:hypothetical protein [Hydrogenophaga sp. 2FB]
MTSEQEVLNSADFRELVSSAHRFLETCDGGDIGSVASPSTWLMGLEPGWSLRDQLRKEEGVVAPRDLDDSYSVDLQLGWPFNRTAFKLLSAIDGGAPEDYVEFARRTRPFERGSKGYFKANLFPVPFKNLEAWDEDAQRSTGFDSKAAYQAWVRQVRFPVLSSQLELHRPKLLIATGMAHLQDFQAVAKAPTMLEHSFLVNGRKKRMFVSAGGVVPLVVLPHLSGGPGGLNSNAAVSQAARVIVESGMTR